MSENGCSKEKKSSVPFIRQCFVTLGVALNVISHGTVLGFSATLIPSLRLPASHIRPTLTEESSIASIIGIALIAGNIIMTPLMSSLGRKPCHIICLLPILIGWFIIVNANSVMEIVFARFLQGITLGMMAPLSPVIIAEMTHPANRGAFLSTISLSVSTGVFISHSVGSYLSWQRTALLMSFIPFLSLIIVICSPESPSWFISKGRIEEASRTFHWLRGDNEKENAELESMINAQNMVRKSSIAGQKVSVSIKFRRSLKYLNETFRKPEFFKPIMTVFFLFLAFQFSGVNVMNAYAIDIIRQVVGPDANAEVFMVALDINRLIVNIISVFLMRILKRRTILSIAGIMCVLCYYLKALYVYLRLNNSLPSALQGQWIPVVILFVYISFSIGLSIVPFAISGEIFPLEYRSLAGCISSIPWSINFFIAVKCFPILTISMGLPLTYILYGTIVLVCLIVLYFSLPETKDRTLQEIEDTFRGRTANTKVSEPLNPAGDVDIMRRNSSVVLYGM